MTSDKQNTGYSAKPFTPTLSAAFHRSNKSPLTPKLATPSPGNPVARRLAQTDHSHPYSTPSKEDLPAAPPSFLSANVTPRSGSRTTRRDAGFPSPTNTPPVSSPQVPYVQPTVGLGLNGIRRTERSPARPIKTEQPRSLRAKTVTGDGQNASRPNSFNEISTGSPMFFHASDARSTNSSEVDLSSRPKQGRTSPASSFLYANGDQERNSSTDESQYSAPTRRAGTLPRPATSRQGPSPSPRLKSPRVSDVTAPPALETHMNRQSPGLDQGLESAFQRYGSPPSVISERPQGLSIGKHRKSSSVGSNSQSVHPKDVLRASPLIVPSSNQPDSLAPVPVLSDQIPTLRPRVFSNGSSVSNDTHQPMPMSPGKSDSGEGQLNARTERKILDLEISNSSLLAINRTLEREMRKQNAELRRFRRLSRSGRLSMAPSNRSFSGTALSTTSELEEGSEMSSIQDDMSDFSDEDSVAGEGVLSPDLAEHDAKHQAHDEKRFMIDLARHQELLVDSQKMNQSLKRCLGLTEELIKEGQKALEYNVHVQDVELGGRVLSPDELDDIGESGRALLSPSMDYPSSFFASPSSAFDESVFAEATSLPLPSSPGGTD